MAQNTRIVKDVVVTDYMSCLVLTECLIQNANLMDFLAPDRDRGQNQPQPRKSPHDDVK